AILCSLVYKYAQIVINCIGCLTVCFINNEYIRNLHNACLHSLYSVTGFRYQCNYSAICKSCYFHLTLSYTHGFYQYNVERRIFNKVRNLYNLWVQATKRDTGSQRTYKDIRMGIKLAHAYPITQQGAIVKGGGGVNSY